MKKYIKKVVYVLSIAIFLLVGNSAFAAGPFNTASNDCQTLTIANMSTGVGAPGSGGVGCGGWTISNVSASAGNVINVHFYYHNASSASATNTRIVLRPSSSGPASNYSFSGTISSDQGSTSGNVSLNISSSQTLTLTDVAWFPNQTGPSGVRTSLPNGQTENDLINGGINIGTVAPGWNTQGELVARFVVGNTVINPPQNYCEITSFTANYNYPNITPVLLSWTTNSANYVMIDGRTYNGSSGSTNVYPNYDRTYTITAYCNNGATDTDSVFVRANQKYDYDFEVETLSARNVDEESATLRGTINSGGDRVDAWFEMPCRSGNKYGYESNIYSQDISEYVDDLSPNRTYRYCAVARDSQGYTQYGNEESFRTDDDNNYDENDELEVTTNRATEVKETSARLNGYIDPNGDYAERWFRYGTSRSSLRYTTSLVNHGTSARSVSDYIYNLTPNTTYYFQLVGSNSYGTNYDANIQSFNTNASGNNDAGTSAVTTIATNVSPAGAQLNGLLLNTTGYNTTVYFEYGTTVAMTQRTTSKSLGTGSSVPFSEYITGLTPNVTYYFRANAENTNGRAYGIVQIFQINTSVPQTNKTTVKQVITKVGTESPVMLKIENRYEMFNIGDMVDYTVTYKNIGSTTLKNPLLQVVLPAHVAYTNSSRGTFATETNTLSVPLEDLAPQAEGVVYVQGKVVSLPGNNSHIVTTALLNYTNSNGAQEDAMAYVLNRDSGEVANSINGLTANAFFAGGFAPDDLCGWLLLIIVILLIALLIRKLFWTDK